MSTDKCSPSPILVCFAVQEEARPFERLVRTRPNVQVVLTGMGCRNAERSVRAALVRSQPRLVISSGFAGGLDPALRVGDVVFQGDEDSPWISCLLETGARPTQFHVASQIATTAAAKRELRASTGADAVEMESGMIRALCREHGIPGATVRVISDAAHENLPLDFNRLMTADWEMNYLKLVWALAKSPRKTVELWRFRRGVGTASERLAAVLARLIEESERLLESTNPGK